MTNNKLFYTLVLNSQDKSSGTNNNANFSINWATFLPDEPYAYEVLFTFISAGGYYVDGTYDDVLTNYDNARIVIDFGNRTYTLDSGTQSNTKTVCIAKYISSSFECKLRDSVRICMNKPTQNNFTVKVLNHNFADNTTLLVDTNAAGTTLAADMTSWTMAIEFHPIV
jgi:hypothetical protein